MTPALRLGEKARCRRKEENLVGALEQLRKVLGLEPVKDAGGNII
jgi:hypothetical protein